MGNIRLTAEVEKHAYKGGKEVAWANVESASRERASQHADMILKRKLKRRGLSMAECRIEEEWL